MVYPGVLGLGATHLLDVRILLSYPDEHDKGEGVHFWRVLQRLGHEVRRLNVATRGSGSAGRTVAGYPADVHLDVLLAEHGPADLYFYIEPLGLIPRGLESSPIPTACVLSDVHRNLQARVRLAQLFDKVFLYQRNYLPKFTDHAPGAVSWMPYACDTQQFRDLGVPRDLDVAFVGQLFGPGSERRRVVSEIGRRYGLNEQRYYLQQEIPAVYSRAKIVVDLPVNQDLNFRVFEALSCGALLLTQRAANGQEELFQENVHFASFNTDDELFKTLDYYLCHDSERMEIARAGHEAVLANHTLEHRCAHIVEHVQQSPTRCAPVRKMSPDEARHLYAEFYERSGRVDALLRLAAEQPRRKTARVKLLASAARSFSRRAIFRW